MTDPELDEQVVKINQKVALEDFAILENLWPVRTPDTLNHELLTEGDAILVRFREPLKDWQAKGWRIDMRAVAAAADDVAYAIPCPARRESRNWVLDAVPLMEA